MNKKGQALIEFIIILPIFILLIFGVIDMGNIIYSKINLEGKMSDVITYHEKDKTIEEIKKELDIENSNYDLVIKKEDKYLNYKLIKRVDIITPGLNIVFDNPYYIEVNRSIIDE